MKSSAKTTASAADRRRVHPRAIFVEIVIAVVAYTVYFLVRGLTEGSHGLAVANAEQVIDLERWLRVYHEEDLQSWVEGVPALVDALNAVYIWLHWPLIAGVALWLLLANPAEYRVTRNAFLISGAIGLVIFAAFPVAPPRFLDGFVDTVSERSELYRTFQPQAFVNRYAAMPSLHFGWNLLIGLALARLARTLPWRIAGAAIPVAMFAAVVLTANHFILDAVAGGGVALLGLWLARCWERRTRPHTAHAERSGGRE